MAMTIEQLEKRLAAAHSMWDLQSLKLADIDSAVKNLVTRLEAVEKAVAPATTVIPPKAAPNA
jgi:hypothetical protein